MATTSTTRWKDTICKDLSKSESATLTSLCFAKYWETVGLAIIFLRSHRKRPLETWRLTLWSPDSSTWTILSSSLASTPSLWSLSSFHASSDTLATSYRSSIMHSYQRLPSSWRKSTWPLFRSILSLCPESSAWTASLCSRSSQHSLVKPFATLMVTSKSSKCSRNKDRTSTRATVSAKYLPSSTFQSSIRLDQDLLTVLLSPTPFFIYRDTFQQAERIWVDRHRLLH